VAVVAQVLDSTSTEEPWPRRWHQRHEGELPSALVKNNAGRTLRIGVSARSILAESK
jgi:hypothetical protein